MKPIVLTTALSVLLPLMRLLKATKWNTKTSILNGESKQKYL